ncbi:hypothetical protein BX616_001719 [Lobosporangium transversale]|nr:hypothetical protein BX616_001719 [Lobosporangium transversale]
MENSNLVEQAVEALVKLILLQDGKHTSDYMDLDHDLDGNNVQSGYTLKGIMDQEARINAVQEYCLRILGSRIAPSLVSDDVHISDLIKKKRKRTVVKEARKLKQR